VGIWEPGNLPLAGSQDFSFSVFRAGTWRTPRGATRRSRRHPRTRAAAHPEWPRGGAWAPPWARAAGPLRREGRGFSWRSRELLRVTQSMPPSNIAFEPSDRPAEVSLNDS